MNEKMISILIGILMVAVLLLASCVQEEREPKELNDTGAIANQELKEKQAAALDLSLSEFELLDQITREEFSKVYPFLYDYPDFPMLYKRVPELENESGIIVVRGYGRFESPSPFITLKVHEGKIEVVSINTSRGGDA